MRTPGIFIFGIVLAPCGLLLDLTCTVAPCWRTINNIPGESTDMVLQQGLWDICQTFTSSRNILCNQPDAQYFGAQIIQIARGLMLTSLVLNAIAIGVASVGVRCWSDEPRWTVAGVGGLLIFISGVLTIIPVAWYTHIMTSIYSTSPDIRVGYCLVLGFIGGIMEVLGGLVMSGGLCHRCADRPKTKTPDPRPMDPVPSVSGLSSVPYYPRYSEMDYPRTSRPPASSSATSYSTKPCDSDL